MDYEVLFESERILYVKVTDKLVNDYLGMINDPDVQKYISHEKRVVTLESELEWIEKKIKNNDIIFSMIEKGTNEFIGNIDITVNDNNIGELGISIATNKQDNHYGQEAIKRIIEYAYDVLKLDGLELNVFNFNTRGIKCYEKVGFVQDGVGKTKEDIHMSFKK